MPKLTSAQERVLPWFNSDYTSILLTVVLTGQLPKEVKKTDLIVVEMSELHDHIVHIHDGSWGLRPNGRKLLAEINTLMAQVVVQVLR